MDRLPQLIKTSLFVQNFYLIKKYRTFFLSVTFCLSISSVAFYSCKTNANTDGSIGDVGDGSEATGKIGRDRIEGGIGGVKYEPKTQNTNSSTKNETQIGTVHQPPNRESNSNLEETLKLLGEQIRYNRQQNDTILRLKETNFKLNGRLEKYEKGD